MARDDQRVGYGLPTVLAVALHALVVVLSVISLPASDPEPTSSSIVQATLVSTETVTDQAQRAEAARARADRKSTRLNSSHVRISYAVFCLKKKMLLRRGRSDTRDGRPTLVASQSNSPISHILGGRSDRDDRHRGCSQAARGPYRGGATGGR